MIGESNPLDDDERMARFMAELDRRIADLERKPTLEGIWTPTPSVGTLGNSTVSARWRRDGMWCGFTVLIGFGTTFSGGTVVAWTIDAPFPAAYEQLVVSKLFIPTAGNLAGAGTVAGSTITPQVSISSTSTLIGGIVNADDTAAPGTGQPSGLGAIYPMSNPGNIGISGRYRVADGY